MTERRVAVVTGATQGIGRAIAVRLAHDVPVVVVNSIDADETADPVVADVEAAGSEAFVAPADVRVAAEVDEIFEAVMRKFGRVDVLVNNAGICPFAEFFGVTEELWDRVVDTNLKGTFLCSQAAARRMIDGGRGGRIISISSVSARAGSPEQVHYAPTKAAQISLMQGLAVVLGKHGITCNSILPGTIRTPANEHLLSDPEIEAADRKRIPVGRIGAPSDVAGVVAFLASDEASFINGAEILVDGGAMSRRA